MIFPMNDAFGLKLRNGVEVLVHNIVPELQEGEMGYFVACHLF
jgi:phosphotransferase system IIA component